MFEGTFASALLEAKAKIDFASLKFPVYLKKKDREEWYRFDSTTRIISVRKNEMVMVGIAKEAPEEAFIMEYSYGSNPCTKDEFETVLAEALKQLNTL